MRIEVMNKSHAERLLDMSKIFYSSDALNHQVPVSIIKDNINNAIGDNNSLTGYVFIENDEIAGFSYVTTYYETEVGGQCVQILDLYVDSKFRGRGFAGEYFQYVFSCYPEAKRFRLEVTDTNATALKVYGKIGFKELSYKQMVIDKN